MLPLCSGMSSFTSTSFPRHREHIPIFVVYEPLSRHMVVELIVIPLPELLLESHKGLRVLVAPNGLSKSLLAVIVARFLHRKGLDGRHHHPHEHVWEASCSSQWEKKDQTSAASTRQHAPSSSARLATVVFLYPQCTDFFSRIDDDNASSLCFRCSNTNWCKQRTDPLYLQQPVAWTQA